MAIDGKNETIRHLMKKVEDSNIDYLVSQLNRVEEKNDTSIEYLLQ